MRLVLPIGAAFMAASLAVPFASSTPADGTVVIDATFTDDDQASAEYFRLVHEEGRPAPTGGYLLPCARDVDGFDGGCLFGQITAARPATKFAHDFQLEMAHDAGTLSMEFELTMASLTYLRPTKSLGEAVLKAQIDGDEQATYQVAKITAVGTTGKMTVALEVGPLAPGPHTLSLVGMINSPPGISARFYLDNVKLVMSAQTSILDEPDPQATMDDSDTINVVNTPKMIPESMFKSDPETGAISACQDEITVTMNGQPMPMPFGTKLTVTKIVEAEGQVKAMVQFLQAFKSTNVPDEVCENAVVSDLSVKVLSAISSFNYCMGYTMICERDRLNRLLTCDDDGFATLTTEVFSLDGVEVNDQDLCTNDDSIDINHLEDEAFRFYKFRVPCRTEDECMDDILAETSDPSASPSASPIVMPTASPSATPTASTSVPTVRPSATPSTSPTAAIVIPEEPDMGMEASGTLVDASFETGLDGFTYVNDTFRNSDNPEYADGFLDTTTGFESKNSIAVTLGGVDNRNIRGMSGGFRRTIMAPKAGSVSISLQYRIDDSDSLGGLNTLGANALVGFDQLQIPLPPPTTEWATWETTFEVEQGEHVLTIGGYLLLKFFEIQSSVVRFDDVLVEYIDMTRRLESSSKTGPILDVDFLNGPNGFEFSGAAFGGEERSDRSAVGRYQETDRAIAVTLRGSGGEPASASGGWVKSFSLDEPVLDAYATVRYKVSAGWLSEDALVLVAVDDQPATAADRLVARTPRTTGWRTATVSLGDLLPGTHRLALGGSMFRRRSESQARAVVTFDRMVLTSGSKSEE